MPFAEKFVEARGFNTRFLEAGNPDNPPLVLIHDGAFGTTAALCWEPLIRQLADRYHILAPELLGWGGTDKAVFLDRSPYAGRIPHIAAFLETQALRGANFVGASFGGSLLMRAVASPQNPWKIARAVSISGTGGPFRLPSGIELLAEYTPSPEAARMLTGLNVLDLEGFDEHIRLRHENSLRPGHWEALNAPRLKNPSAPAVARTDSYLDDLAGVRDIAVLLMEGRHDTLLEPGWAERMAALSPAFRSVVVEGAHEPNYDQPELVARLVDAFFRDGGR